MIKQPEYQGKWSPPQIDNQASEGFWKPRKIANPAHFEDKTPVNFEPIGAIGFDMVNRRPHCTLGLFSARA
jgi:calnexin